MTPLATKQLRPLDDRGPLRVLFVITSMPVGGAETLLVNLIRRLDRNIVLPEVCCLKERGPLGEEIATEVPVYAHLINGRTDIQVIGRLVRLMKSRRIDAVVTVGAGDKMFWGRIAAWWAGVPVITSALHSTGWPDGIGWLNRRLTSITDGFIAVAQAHAQHLVERERLPSHKVSVIPNGIDTHRFVPATNRAELRQRLRLPVDGPLVAIVAALRPEKNHARFLRVAHIIRQRVTSAQFLIVGDGPQRSQLEHMADALGLGAGVHFLGSRPDIPDILAASDLFALTSDNEASPVSIMEAMSCGLPVVASRVGSIDEMVQPGVTGYCVEKTDEKLFARQMIDILSCPQAARHMGVAGRARVAQLGSLDTMVRGYEQLLTSLYSAKVTRPSGALRSSNVLRIPHVPSVTPSRIRET
jgi:glycosyltransferase involved in cell wall biosynthesis